MSPDFQYAKKIFDLFQEFNSNSLILSSSTIKHKSAAEALLKMCFGNMIGFVLTANEESLFDNGYCDILIEIDSQKISNINDFLSRYDNLDLEVIGKTIDESKFIMKDIVVDLETLLTEYTSKYESVFLNSEDIIFPADVWLTAKLTNVGGTSISIKDPDIESFPPIAGIPSSVCA